MKRDEGGTMKDELSSSVPQNYAGFLSDIKRRIRHAQTRAVLAVNAELTRASPDSLQSSLPSIEQIERELEGIEP